MSRPQASFYVTGGGLRGDAPSYVPRQADIDLYEGLKRGDFCYVLNSRQMGKSSLVTRTANRMRTEGAAVVLLDLNSIGKNLTVEQWYQGLLDHTGRDLDLADELEEFWDAHLHLGPLQRFVQALKDVVLERIAGPVVIFVDEIDMVRSLPFSADEFFAAVRQCYNRRAEEAELDRLTFCLVGVATPSDLIQDLRMTPFNIGRRIELHDFTETEAQPLAQGLGREERLAAAILKRILYWTGGHPYLTQRLCQKVVEDAGIQGPAGVDRVCEGLFLSHSAREKDDNLLFVRDRILRSEVDKAALLDLYGQVRRHHRVRDEELNPLVAVLRLSGIARVVDGYLWVRNRIYYRVFDREWVLTNMPDAEKRRQRRAYRNGLLRASAVALPVVAVLLALAVTAVVKTLQADKSAEQAQSSARQAAENAKQAGEQRDRAEKEHQEAEIQARDALEAKKEADQARQKAEAMAGQLKQTLYHSLLTQAQGHWLSSPGSQAELDLEQSPPDLRDWEWNYLKRLCQANLMTLREHSKSAWGLAFSPDGNLFVSGGEDNRIILWDALTGRYLRDLLGHKGIVYAAAFSPDNQHLATSSSDNTVKIWNPATGELLRTLSGDLPSSKRSPTPSENEIYSVTYSPDGSQLATTAKGWTVKVWNTSTYQEDFTIPGDNGLFSCPSFSPDGRFLAAAADVQTVKIWNTASGKEERSLSGHVGRVNGVAFSPDGQRIASAGYDGTVRIWEAATGKELRTLRGHEDRVATVAFSPDGRHLASGSWDKTVKIWDVATEQEPITLRGHGGFVLKIAYNPDGWRLASTSTDKTVILWDATSGQEAMTYQGHTEPVTSVAFSPDGRRLASAGSWDNKVRVWDPLTGQGFLTLGGFTQGVSCVAYSKDGQFLAAGSGVLGAIDAVDNKNWDIKVWESATGKEIRTLLGHTGTVSAVAFSPDGKHLASASKDQTVRVWDLSRPPQASHGGLTNNIIEQLQTVILKGHTDEVWTLAYSPDGKILATGGKDKKVILWDTASGQVIRTITDFDSPVRCLAFSPEGDRLATGTGIFLSLVQEEVKIWDVHTGENIHTLPAHKASITAVVFHPRSPRLATASEDHTIKIWDTNNWSEILTLPAHQNWIQCAAFSPDGTRLASGGFDKTVRVWNGTPTHDIFTLRGHRGTINGVSISPDGKYLASAGYDKSVKVWDVTTGMEFFTLNGHASRVSGVAFSPDGKHLASSSGDKTVRIWDFATRKNIATFKNDVVAPTLAAVTTSLAVPMPGAGPWSLACALVSGTNDFGGSFLSVAFSPDGHYLASGNGDKTVRVWDARTNQLVHVLKGHTNAVLSLAFSRDSRFLASAGEDALAKTWDLETGTEQQTFTGHDGPVTDVAFSGDGKWLATGGDDQTVRIWDLASGQTIRVLKGHTGPVQSVAFRPNGRFAASVSDDETLRVWDPDTGQAVLVLRGHTGSVRGLAYTPDGKRLASTSVDQTIKIWDATDNRAEVEADEHKASKEVRTAWYRHEAEDCETARQWFAAVFHLSRLIDSDPKNSDFTNRRGQAYANLGQWSEAIGDFTRVVEWNPDKDANWYSLAMATLGKGDTAKYRQICRDMLERFAQSNDPDLIIRTVFTSLTSPEGLTDAQRLVDLAEKAKAQTEEGKSYWPSAVWGAALYRAGRFEDAAKPLADAVDKGHNGSAALFLTMAHQRLGHTAKARSLMDKCLKAIAEAKKANASGDSTNDWKNFVQLDVLSLEAEGVLKAADSKDPKIIGN